MSFSNSHYPKYLSKPSSQNPVQDHTSATSALGVGEPNLLYNSPLWLRSSRPPSCQRGPDPTSPTPSGKIPLLSISIIITPFSTVQTSFKPTGLMAAKTSCQNWCSWRVCVCVCVRLFSFHRVRSFYPTDPPPQEWRRGFSEVFRPPPGMMVRELIRLLLCDGNNSKVDFLCPPERLAAD